MAKKTPITVQFDGTESLEQIFQKLPLEYARKPMVAAFRKAGKPLVDEIRRMAAPGHRQLIGIQAGKTAAVMAGYKKPTKATAFGRLKAYWRDYGTLQNRLSGYPFRSGTRKQNWKGGVKPRNTVSTAWANKAGEVEKIIDRDMEKVTLRFLNKHAKK